MAKSVNEYILKSLRIVLWGHHGELAATCEVDIATVGRVLRGEYHNQKIINEAISLRNSIEQKLLNKNENEKTN